MTSQFHAPVAPYTPIDALNRRAAAVGSPSYAALAAHADYNGHRVSVTWNDYRGYYVAEYMWAGRVVLARGEFGPCLEAALREFRRGACGSSIWVTLREGDDAALALCEATPELVPGPAPQTLPWWSWQHEVAVQSVRDYAHPGTLRVTFDWPLVQAATSRDEYESAVKAKYGRIYS